MIIWYRFLQLIVVCCCVSRRFRHLSHHRLCPPFLCHRSGGGGGGGIASVSFVFVSCLSACLLFTFLGLRLNSSFSEEDASDMHAALWSKIVYVSKVEATSSLPMVIGMIWFQILVLSVVNPYQNILDCLLLVCKSSSSSSSAFQSVNSHFIYLSSAFL